MSSMKTPPSTATHPTPNEPRSMLQDVIASIFEPGTNSGLVQAMSYSFYALFVTLFGMVVLTGGNIHVVALLVLSLGLYASIRWSVGR
ncbi:BQ5605_C002g01232 [Microbotryum silenes-dioicae]|uniref:BQ5605_C002g01232 protein n=1 Tax=Microbotryum silenes-dioicae TaxID=796604 RepID=A0A2X0M213_9BASI|nr:BQ5605_C002g01232 [Microbotryum silenes-dioicae]